MATYQAKSSNSRTFELTQNDKSIGQLTYTSWFRFDALITMGNYKNFQIEPKGFWGTTIELKENENVLVKFKMNWSGEIVIQTYFDGQEKGYTLKHKGFFNESFLLVDQDEIELLMMKPHLQWFKRAYEYQIETVDGFDRIPNKELLLMTTLHGANYYMSLASGE